MSSRQTIFDLMCKKFSLVHDKRKHKKCIIALAEAYKKYDNNEFWESYKKCIRITLSYIQKNSSIDNTLEFGALLAVQVRPQVQRDDGISPFLECVFEFILETHNVTLSGIRYNTCHFLNLISNSMDDKTYLSGELSNDIIVAMKSRMNDKSTKVGVEAVYALRRLQKPGEDTCPVIEAYIFHLSRNPNSDIRKAVMKNIVKNEKTMSSVIERIYDIDYSVRNMAYIFLTRMEPESFTIKQRREILYNGLQDKNTEVSKLVREILLKNWLIYYNNDITKFLYALNIEKETDVIIIVLNNLFTVEYLTLNDLFKQLPINQKTNLMLIDELSIENIFFWYHYLKHAQKLTATTLFHQKAPKLNLLCCYISQYRKMVNHEKVILCQLLKMTKLYKLSHIDEKTRLKQLLDEILLSEILDLEVIEITVDVYAKVEANIPKRIDALTSLINSIGISFDDINLVSIEEKKHNTRKMSKSLAIMCSILKSKTITKITSSIRTLFEIILPICKNKHDDKHIQVQLLNAVGLCMFLDAELAYEHIPIFIAVPIDTDNDFYDELIISLEIIFDLFAKYGLDYFDLDDPVDDVDPADDDNDGETTSIEASQLDKHVIKILAHLLESKEPRVQLKAVEGFIKLLLMKRINSVTIVSQLIKILHMPCSNNTQLKRAVTSFFKYYPSLRKENQKILETSFLPTILDIFNAPADSELFGIDPSIVGHFILDLTRYNIDGTQTDDSHYIAHNNISFCMLEKIINSNNENYVTTLVECLVYVDIKITDEAIQNKMLDKCNAVIDKWQNEKILETLENFRKKIKTNEQVDNINPAETQESDDDDYNTEDDIDKE